MTERSEIYWKGVIIYHHEIGPSRKNLFLFHDFFPFRFCTSGLPSDVTIEVGEMSFHLHKVHFICLCLILNAVEHKKVKSHIE
jgi:hypothetical protein